MRVKVLKPFPCAVEPHQVRMLEEGEIVTLGADVDVEGLHDEGYIEETDEGAELVAIPDDWRELHWFKLQALAASIAGEKPKDKNLAVYVIEAELAQRAASAGA